MHTQLCDISVDLVEVIQDICTFCAKSNKNVIKMYIKPHVDLKKALVDTT